MTVWKLPIEMDEENLCTTQKLHAYQGKPGQHWTLGPAATEGRPNRRTAGPCAPWDVPPPLWWWRGRFASLLHLWPRRPAQTGFWAEVPAAVAYPLSTSKHKLILLNGIKPAGNG
jgi:hypothetical protein